MRQIAYARTRNNDCNPRLGCWIMLQSDRNKAKTHCCSVKKFTVAAECSPIFFLAPVNPLLRPGTPFGYMRRQVQIEPSGAHLRLLGVGYDTRSI